MIVAKSPRTAALVLALLMVVPVFPTTVATHIAGTVDVPVLPPVRPSDTCVGVQGSQEVLARLNQLVANPEYGFRDDVGVPSLCGLDGKPVETWREVVRQLDAILNSYRAAARELQRQLDQRLETTYPEGPCPPGDAPGEAAPQACAAVRPKVTLLSDTFDGRRVGGFGDWTVVSPGGEDPAFYESLTSTLNGTQHTWRFGTQQGYERGAHEWLVSPQVDLGAVAGDPVVVRQFVTTYVQARESLQTLCYNENALNGQNPIYDLCGQPQPDGGDGILVGLVEAYGEAMDAYTRGLPIGQAAATLDLTFRHNLAFAADGVRVWLWTGEDAPTRIQLYNLSLGTEPGTQRCIPGYEFAKAGAPADAQNSDELVCVAQGGKAGKAFLLMGSPTTGSDKEINGQDTKAFKDASRAPLAGESWALTGDLKDFRTVRVDLTDHVGERVWVLFEVMTLPDTGRGEDYFGDAGRFPRRQDYGFELARVHVEGDSGGRNLRLNDIASAYDRIPRVNPFGDARDVRTTIPPGEDLRVRVHNAGAYHENATLEVRFEEQKYVGEVPVGGFEGLPASTVRVVNLRPNEAREVPVPWPKDLVEGNLYRATATLRADGLDDLRLDDEGNLTEPGTTSVRPANRAEAEGNATRTLLLRAFTHHDLTAVHVPSGNGPVVEVCSAYTPGDGCTPLYVADKGEMRLLVTGVRNDGSLPEDATATLDLRLDGVDKNSFVIDGVERSIVGLLPGETRTLQWSITPTDPGAYDATITVQLANGETVLTLHRLVFVQRSAGLVCLDDLAENRECGPSFSTTRPEAFRDESPTALAVAPDGTAWIATAIQTFLVGEQIVERGGLYRQVPGGEWERVQDLTRSALEKAGLTPAREDLWFDDIRSISFGPNGTIFLAGDHATLLQRGADGSMRAHGYPAALSTSLRALAGPATHVIEQGDNVSLAGSAIGGAGSYAFTWAIHSAPSGAKGEFHSIRDGQEGGDEGGFVGHTNFTPILPATLLPTSAPVSYRLILTATDAAGAAATALTTIVVRPRAPDCVRESGRLRDATLVGVDPVDAAQPASADLACLQVRLTPQDVLVDVAPRGLPASDGSRGYQLAFRSGGVDFSVTATWSANGQVAISNPTPASLLATGSVVEHTLPNGTTASKVRIAINRTSALFPERLDGISVTVVGAGGDRLPDAGGLARTLDRETAALPAPTQLVASPSVRGIDRVDLEWFAPKGAQGYEIQAATWEEGPWATVGTLDTSSLTSGLPDDEEGVFVSSSVRGLQHGVAYRFRVAELDRAPPETADRGPFSAVATAAPMLLRPMHQATAMFNGTLFVGGILGQLWRLNASSGLLEHVPLTTQEEDGTVVGYIGDVHALLATSDGARLYAAGDHGAIFTNIGRGEEWWRTGWTRAATALPTDASVRALAEAGGAVYAVGSPGVVVRSNRSSAFENVTAPALLATPLDGASAFAGPDGRLFLIASDGPRPDGIRGQYVVSCLACDGSDWTYPALPLPSVGEEDSLHRARLLEGAGAGGRVLALAEAGTLVEYARRGTYANEEDWSVQPALLVNDGAAYELRLDSASFEQALIFTPEGATPTDLVATSGNASHRQGWSKLRITLSHNLASVGTANTLPRVRVFYEPLPYVDFPVDSAGRSTCSTSCAETTRGPIVWEQPLNVSRTAGWEETVITAPPPTLDLEVAGPQARAMFSKIDLFAPGSTATNWVVDAVKVEAYFADSRTWRPILEWRGPAFTDAPVNATVERQPPEESPNAWRLVTEPFNIDSVSPWHISYDLADRPVWVANDEFNAWRPGGTRPHILGGWDSRLVSPIIDLTEASDAVVSFRHDYAFRMMVPDSEVASPDGGWVEVQYEMRGAECGSDDDSVTCWSRFYTVCPEAPDFPAVGPCPAGTGYPRLKDQGFLQGATYSSTENAKDPYGHGIGPAPPSAVPGSVAYEVPAYSYWGRSVDPDSTGVIRGIRATEDYDQVDIVLKRQQIKDERGESVDLNGRRVRVGFHVLTSTANDAKWNYTSELQVRTVQTSFPGEGWYLTDFKVRGDRVLGMDLAATNASFEVGYDVALRGVGPGTKVPVNVTIENRGRFDVPGYTAEMRIDRVVDASKALVTHVATVPLRQQPLLDKGASRNHTFLWEVPGEVAKVSGAPATPTSSLRHAGFTLRSEGDLARTFRLDAFANGTGTVRVAVVLAPAGTGEAAACAAVGNPALTVFERSLAVSRETARESASLRLALPTHFDPVSGMVAYVLCARQEGFAGVFQAALVEEADYAVTLVATPMGIARDEDPTDNLARLGTPTRPVHARPSPAFDVETLVTPADATKDITRFLPITLVNVGNVALGGKGEDVQEYFRVTRRIMSGARDALDTTDCDQWRAVVQATGRTGRMVDCRVWNTTVPLGPGARASLASLSSEFSLADDLFWKPPTSADYRIEVTVELLERPANAAASRKDGAGPLGAVSVERAAKSFDTYLFDDAELGPRGANLRGDWEFEPGWGERAPGFRSTKAYGFGDQLLMRYAPDVDSSLVTPIMDLSTARSARFAFYHRYDFEAGFDGGVIEASADGGATWHRLTPVPNPVNGLPEGYNATLGLAPSSPLDEDGGDPLTRSLAFTGDSRDLPAASDGWVLSIFDLTEFPLIREDNVPYEMFDAAALLNYKGTGSLDELFRSTEGGARLYPTAASNAYFETSWRVGAVEDYRYWEVQNLTQDTVRPLVGEDFWWSGSANMVDDELRPVNNTWLVINVTDVASKVQSDDRVVVEWWEWMDRHEQFGSYLEAKYGSGTDHSPDDFRAVFSWTNGGQNTPLQHRFNVSKPSILETRGQWIHLQADITDWLRPSASGPAITDIDFVYAPAITDINPATATPSSISTFANTSANYNARWRDDRGLVVDGFFINASKVVGGQVTSQRSLMTEDEAWRRYARIEVCTEKESTPAPYNENDLGKLPCYQPRADGTRYNRSVMEPKEQNGPPTTFGEDTRWDGPAGVPGRTWARVSSIPGIPAGWRVVDVRDKDLRWDNPGDRLPTGEAPVAWYTGSICQEDVLNDRSLCLLPGEESRLVTPALDLSTIAGSTASLVFDHRYAFWLDGGKGTIPLASGGAVEIQTFDEETKTWSPWKQIYPDREGMYLDIKADGPVADVDPTRKGTAVSGHRAGYSAYTGNLTLDTTGRELHRDAPFESHPHYDVVKRNLSYIQFLYSGKSSDITGDPDNAWVPAEFDLQDYIGKRVRVGFHLSVAGAPRNAQNQTPFALDHTSTPDNEPRQTGWWITNLAVVGKVLNGAPVQLRARAVTDGNVGDGFWEIDDAGVFGSQYGDNVGIFVDQSTSHGGVAGESVTLNVSLRNLGTSVRPNLALDVRELGGHVLTLNATAGPKIELLEDNQLLRVSGITLAPGQTIVIPLNLTVAPELSGERVETLLYLEAKEFNPLDRRFVKITTNEVQGFLRRSIPFTAERHPTIELDLPRALQAGPLPGAPLDVSVEATNRGFAPVKLNVTCAAALIVGHGTVDHRKEAVEDPRLGEAYACELVDGPATLAPLANATLTYRVRPTSAGDVRIVFDGTFELGERVLEVAKAADLTVPVGRSPVIYHEGFDDPRSVLANFTGRGSFAGSPNGAWEYLRGHAKPGSLLLGTNETDLRATGGTYQCATAHCVAVTPPIDLHNYTDENVVLSFWHQKRLAKHDGAQVSVQFLLDEARPNSPGAWSPLDVLCIAEPRGGYDVSPPVLSRTPDAQGQPFGQDILYPKWNGIGQTYSSPRVENGATLYPAEFFTNDRLDEGWTRVAFDLNDQFRGSGGKCDPDGTLATRPANPMSIVGHTVRFVFTVYGAPAYPPNGASRGQGHGWLIDDITVSTAGIQLGPAVAQQATLLDNTTKTFNVVLANDADYPDLVAFSFDAASSSAPAGSVQVPTEPVLLQAREKKLVPIHVTLPRDPSLLPTQFKARVVATSLRDPHAYDSTDLQLDFAPRQWAELAVSAQAPRSTVQEGTETFVPITIENNGVVGSVATRVRITDRVLGDARPPGPCPENGGTVDGVTCIDLPPMPSYFQDADQASRVLEFRWRPEKGTVGLHTLTIEADPDQKGEEYTRSNNVVTLTVAVSELLLPDVDVSAPDALRMRNAVGQALEPLKEGGVTRYESTTGELVTLEVKVRNVGKAAATNVDVRAFIGPLSLPARTIPFIAPDNEVVLAFNWVAQKGDYPVEVVARSEQVELSTANNRNPAIGVTLLVVKGYEVKVALDPIEGVLEPGTEVKVPFNVTNSGNAGEEVRIVPRAPEGWNVTVPRSSLFLRAGETYGAIATVVVPAHAVAGEQFISVDAIARGNPMKAATASAKGVVRASYDGAVGTTAARAAPPSITLPIDLQNAGNSLEPWTVTVDLPPGWAAAETLPAKVVVPAHGATTWPLRVALPQGVPPGERTLAVHATLPDGTRRDGTVEVRIDPLRAAVAKVVDDRPREAQGALSYPVLVENVGNVEQPFEVLLLEKTPGLEATLAPARFTLAPGAKAVATLTVTPDAHAPAGAVQLATYAAFAGVVPDTAEGRANQQQLQVSVVRPDLRLSPLDYAKAGVDTGERVVVKVPVKNEGQAAVTDLPVHLFVDDVFISETRVAKLAPGEKRDVTLNWTALPGKHTVTVVVDPYKDTVDAQRDDNAVSGLVDVQSAPIRGLVGGQRVPFDGALLVLVAVAAALVVLTPSLGARRPPR